ncbi:hypothetical protein [Pseudarthrobacter sp. fls2-241-R2A-168]|uniref:hypothetical protein n=1 Tax=Pseudarthrobacter sp. fls2-241-R2A-168 TaxID=3040304 RepID=UPI0025567FCF|nr:hypothetical protein [Pseudarthrobacter sp. fls2-241-R2A-168]
MLVIGYLSAQIDGAINGYLIDLSGKPGIAIDKRYPWELQAALLLVGLAAIAAYRRLATLRAVRITVLGILIVGILAAGAAYMPAQSTMPNLFSISAVYGGVSPFTLAALAGVLADLFLGRQHESESL